MPDIEVVLVIGRYAVAWHLPDMRALPLAQLARGVADPDVQVMPHPSPRNGRWLRQNPWFEAEILPKLRARIAKVIV